MEKKGPSLKHLHKVYNGSIPKKDVAQIGLQLLDALQIMHDSNVVYNNLALEHVLVGDGTFSQGSRSRIMLVDFSKAKAIVDSEGIPVEHDGVILKDKVKMYAPF